MSSYGLHKLKWHAKIDREKKIKLQFLSVGKGPLVYHRPQGVDDWEGMVQQPNVGDGSEWVKY